MFTKIFSTFFLCIFLVSCGSNNETSPNLDIASSEWLVSTQLENFSISLPSSWEIIDDSDGILPIPNQGTIELAVSSTKQSSGFYNNLLVLSDTLAQFQTSQDFSLTNNIGARDAYVEYKEISRKDFTFIDKESSLIYIFEARYNTQTPKLKFLQVARICEANTAYLLTIALPTSVQVTTQYEQLLQTFACSEEESEGKE